MYLLQVGRSTLVPGADHALESIHNIKEALPEIWEVHDCSESDAVPASAVVETTPYHRRMECMGRNNTLKIGYVEEYKEKMCPIITSTVLGTLSLHYISFKET